MKRMIFALFGIYLCLGFFLGLKKPTAYVIFYILATTKFLGFFGPENVFIIGGLGLGLFSLNLVTIISSFFPNQKVKQISKAKKFIFLLFLITLYGILLPYLNSESSFLMAIKSSKEFWSIGFLFYLFKRRAELNFEIILKFTFYLGFYLSALEIIYLFTRIAPPFYIEVKEYFVKMRIYYPTYISLALLIFYYFQTTYKKVVIPSIFVYPLMLCGVVLAGHTSLVIGTILGLGLLNFRNRIINEPLLLIFFGGILTICGLGMYFIFESEISALSHQISLEADVALSSREIYNDFRWQAINDRPLTGYGFLQPSSKLGSQLIPDNESVHMQQLGTIDSGYIDLFTKFGYLGTSLYLLFWMRMILKPLFNSRKSKNLDLAIVGASFLLPYFLINYTWSVFSYTHGLIPGFIAIFMILYSDELNFDNKNVIEYYSEN